MTVVWALARFGIIPSTFFTENGWRIGSVLEIFVLSLALGDRFNLIRQEKEQAQREALEQQAALTNSYARFVPMQLLDFLGKKQITEVRLGDATEYEMTRVFIKLGEPI